MRILALKHQQYNYWQFFRCCTSTWVAATRQAVARRSTNSTETENTRWDDDSWQKYVHCTQYC